MSTEKDDLLGLEEFELLARDPNSKNEFHEVIEHLDELGGTVAENSNVRELKELARAYELKQNRSQLIRYLDLAATFAKEIDDPIVVSLIQNVLVHLRE